MVDAGDDEDAGDVEDAGDGRIGHGETGQWDAGVVEDDCGSC